MIIPLDDKLEKISNSIIELLKGQTYSDSKDVLRNCLQDIEEKSIVR